MDTVASVCHLVSACVVWLQFLTRHIEACQTWPAVYRGPRHSRTRTKHRLATTHGYSHAARPQQEVDWRRHLVPVVPCLLDASVGWRLPVGRCLQCEGATWWCLRSPPCFLHQRLMGCRATIPRPNYRHRRGWCRRLDSLHRIQHSFW